MINNKINYGEIRVQVSAPKIENILNLLWNNDIYISEIKKVDYITVRFKIPYQDFEKTKELVKRCNGKLKVIGKSGMILWAIRIKSQLSLVVGIGLFFLVLYVMSNYIWAIDIQTKNNLTPLEVRQQLDKIGIKPGLKKSSINVYEIERKMEDLNDQIMWIRTRIEGSTLKLIIEEKINPPSTKKENPNQVVAKMDGEIKRVFTTMGNCAVKPGDIVKKGDILILPVQGREGFEKDVKPKGTIIANTFYEKSMEIQISGKKLMRTGRKDNDIFLSFWGKKIYLKKAINGFKSYDKIEESKYFFNNITYFEKAEEDVDVDKNKAVEEAEEKLTQSLKKYLSNDAKIMDNKLTVEDIGEGKIRVNLVFTVEQNIAEDIM